MRIHLSCSKCVEAIAPGETGVAYSKVCSINDAGTYILECPNGHKSTIVLRTPKHEVLYLIGANALLDGYLRDAVLSFQGAMERFFEFALRVFVRKNEIPEKDFKAAWGLMPKQSERQFGAFVLAWLFESKARFSDAPLAKIEKRAETRNGVVHKGTIPTLGKCIEYGQHVADVIGPIERVLQTDYAKWHKEECLAPAFSFGAKSSEPITVLSEFSVLATMLKEGAKLEAVLPRLVRHRSLHGVRSLPSDLLIQRHVTKDSSKVSGSASGRNHLTNKPA